VLALNVGMSPPDFRLDGRVALVTGASRGIGRAVALGLAQAGADVVLAARKPPDLDVVADEVRALGRRALAVPTHLGRRPEVDRLFDTALDAFGRLDVLVNNAGGTFEAPFLQVNERGFRTLVDLNLGSVWHGTQAAAAWWIANGVAGRVINVASTEGLKACPGYAAYSAAKAGVLNLTKTLAVELGPYGIRVNAIAPDYTHLEASVGVEPPDEAALGAKIPLGRYGQPADHAGAVLFFASELSAWITGQTLVIDGGAFVAARVEGALPVKPQDARTR
jgi:NAD(P)-dependent dehydrogenase (short-subunit alcohol dehydrogenase family)